MNPEHPKSPIDTTVQSIEEKENASRKVAFDKMHRSFDKDFRRYGVRYMNVQELFDAIERQCFQAREVWLENHGNDRNPNGTYDWDDSDASKSLFDFILTKQWFYSDIHTNWDLSHRARTVNAAFRGALREAHQHAQQEKGDKKDIRKRTMHYFSELLPDKLRNRAGAEDITELLNMFEFEREMVRWVEEHIADKPEQEKKSVGSIVQRIHENDINKEELKKILPEIEAVSDEELRKMLTYSINKTLGVLKVPEQHLPSIAVMKDFYRNPDSFLEKKENLRKLRDALFYLTGELEEVTDFFVSHPHQYHIAAFFDEAALKTYEGRNWGWLKGAEENFSPKDFLGVAVMFSDRKLIERLIALSKRAGEMAFFVVDKGNIMRYPQKINLETM